MVARSLPFSAALSAAFAVVMFTTAASAAPTVRAIDPPAVPPADAIAPTTIPTAPTNLVAQSMRPDAVALLWRDRSNDESSFVIEARPSSNPVFQNIGSVGANVTAVFVEGLDAATEYVFRVRASNASGPSASTNAVVVTTLAGAACAPADDAMCLNNGEFRVQALFLTKNVSTGEDGPSGAARAVKLVADSGYLWFFSDTNIEVVVKVLDGCATNGNFWVFAAGLTNVRVLLSVTDTVTGDTRPYGNPFNRAFPPTLDTSAFATCASAPR